MPSPILSTPRKDSTEETWATAQEEEPLLEASKAKAVSVKSQSRPITPMGVDPVAAPPGTAPIQLPPDVDLSAEYPFNDQPTTDIEHGTTKFQQIGGKLRSWTGSVSTDNRSILRYMGRGCLIVLMTPIAFIGMALYATGAILEGVAMVMKGVGAVGGNLMLSRRVEGQKSPIIQPTVSWA